MNDLPAGYPGPDATIEIGARAYYDLVAENAYKEAVIEALTQQLELQNEKIIQLTESVGLIGFASNNKS